MSTAQDAADFQANMYRLTWETCEDPGEVWVPTWQETSNPWEHHRTLLHRQLNGENVRNVRLQQLNPTPVWYDVT